MTLTNQIIKIEKKSPPDLKQFIEDCENALVGGEPITFHFPPALVGKAIADAEWEVNVDKIKELNKLFLSQLRKNANLYAIFTKSKDDKWVIKYVGQRKAIEMRQRITNHLIKKSNETGAKLDYVRKAVSKGEEIGLRFLLVEPDTIRAYVEEEIISRNKPKLTWNDHG